MLSEQYKVTTVDIVQEVAVLCKAKIKVEPSRILDRIEVEHVKKVIEQVRLVNSFFFLFSE